VHPAKLEIRFAEEQKAFKAVYHSIKETLLKSDLVANASDIGTPLSVAPGVVALTTPSMDSINPNSNVVMPSPVRLTKEDVVVKEPSGPEVKIEVPKEKTVVEEPLQPPGNILEEIHNKKKPRSEKIMEEKTNYEPPRFTDMYKKTFGRLKVKQQETVKYKEVENVDDTLQELENISVFNMAEEESMPNYKYVGTLFFTYIVIEIESEIYIIDQHAAHERIMYEQIKSNFYDAQGKDSQIMLLPDIIEVSHKEKDIINENVDLFKQAGFMFDEFGDNTIRLIGVPTICLELDTKELFKEILDQVNTIAITAIQEKEEKLISVIACKAAVKANTRLSEAEVKDLMNRMLKLQNPFTCPHGRPTAIRMSQNDIEKKFGRK